jgi:hypothetical protein
VHIHIEKERRRECELICAELPSSSSSYQMTPEAIYNVSSFTLIGYISKGDIETI